MAECNIIGEESNIEKKTWYIKEHVPNFEGLHHQRKSNYTIPIKDKNVFKISGKTI